MNLIMSDVLFGFTKARKGESVFQALYRQGREVRKAKRVTLSRAIKSQRFKQ